MNQRLLSIAVVAVLFGCVSGARRAAVSASTSAPPVKYGRLQVIGSHLCGSEGKPVALRGMSTMGLQWYSGILNAKAVTALAEDWKADIIRLALYVGEGGYASHPELKQHVWKGIELAIAHGLYVLVDWHVLKPGNPNDPTYAGAQAFFDEASRRYGAFPNVLYEIMNEPNGTLDWSSDLKPYAAKTVATIRANDPDGIIIIGSGTWSQDVDIAAADPVAGKNLMLAVHFYAGSHGEALRNKVESAIRRGAAVFCSEWGTSEESGAGGPFLRESEAWLAFLDRHNISWINWSLCDSSMTSSALKSLARVQEEGNSALAERESFLVPETMGPDGYPIWGPDELTESGAFVRARLRAAAKNR